MGLVVRFPRHVLVNRDVRCSCTERESHGSCPFCDGGISLCVVCGGAEASMPSHCPGKMMTDLQAECVQAGVLDYRVNEWRCT